MDIWNRSQRMAAAVVRRGAGAAAGQRGGPNRVPNIPARPRIRPPAPRVAAPAAAMGLPRIDPTELAETMEAVGGDAGSGPLAHHEDARPEWSEERRSRLVNSGGLAARLAKKSGVIALGAVSQQELLSVTEQAVLAMFGRDRAAILRVQGLLIQLEQQKEWKSRNAQKTQLAAQGQQVPSDYCPPPFFYTFQFVRETILARSPLLIRELEQWAWMHSRWAISDPGDMSKSSDFLHVMGTADKLSLSLSSFAADLTARPGLAVPSTMRNEVVQMMLRFTEIRARHVNAVLEIGLQEEGLADLHGQFRILGRAYSHDSATLNDFLNNVFSQLTSQAVSRGGSTEQEEFCARAFLHLAFAFIGGLKGGPAPSALNPLDNPVAAVNAVTAVVATTIQQPVHMAPPGPAFLAQYTTVQQPIPPTYPADGFLSLDAMVRQTAAGYRAAGALAPGFTSGGFEGHDLPPATRRVLHAQQLQQGIRAVGLLTTMPPWGELPPLSSYPPPVPAPTGAHPPTFGDAAPTPQLATPTGSPYVTQQRTTAGGSAAALHSTTRSTVPASSDEQCIPFSVGMLGAYSPYRSIPLPPTLTCYECGALRQHFAQECPVRCVRVRGEAPPGWKIDGPGAVAKDATAWSGADLTDAARLQYRTFLAKHPLLPHHVYPISLEEIVGSTPVPPRRPLYRPDGGRRR